MYFDLFDPSVDAFLLFLSLDPPPPTPRMIGKALLDERRSDKRRAGTIFIFSFSFLLWYSLFFFLFVKTIMSYIIIR